MRICLMPMTALLAACGGSEPACPPPTDDEARAAYVRAIRADFIDSPQRHEQVDPGALANGSAADVPETMGKSFNAESENSARLNAQQRIDSLGKVTVGECSWGGIDSGNVVPQSRRRIEGRVENGYTCDYEVFHHTPTRGLVSARGSGAFYQRDGRYEFAGIEEANFKEVVD
jgi:hypothetical protein